VTATKGVYQGGPTPEGEPPHPPLFSQPTKTKPPAANGSQIKARVEKLEQDVTLLAWLHTEQQQRVVSMAAMVAGLVAEQMQPRVKQEILRRLMG
jgi:hypothetical protein